MHLAEGTLPLAHAAAGWALAVPPLAWSLAGTRRGSGDPDAAARAASRLLPAATSLLFAATLLPLPVPVLGATSHICLTPVLALLLGVRAVVWPTFFVLGLQALFFAHGGLSTLGVNTLSLGLLGPLAAVGCASVLRIAGAPAAIAVGVACGIADLAVYLGDAAVLGVALADIAAPVDTFSAVALGLAPVQIPLAIVEGVVSVALVRLLVRRKPTLLPSWMADLTVRPPPPGVTGALLVVLALLGSGCNYQGIDGTVFGAAAGRAGQSPTDSVVDLSQGELGLAIGLLLPFTFGFVAGRTWERLGGADHAPPR
ncbi:MAG: energy-coupling factor ABC transporter permease [Deltaproteobacteria bacterium]|nr:energy-coupling factor ABC transporter permease [Deltaproteobacteria bacterium]